MKIGKFVIIIFLLSACTPSQAAPNSANDQPPLPSQSIESSESAEPVIPIETSGPNCLGDEPHAMGIEIADQFEEANYEDVMTWFCNGAEFEDILVALQTEKDTGKLAEDLLKLLAEGQSWEEIWKAIGYTE